MSRRPNELLANDPQHTLLLGMLQLAVPKHIDELNGLPPDTLTAIGRDAITDIAHHGDELQYNGPNCGAAFNSLACGLAFLALTAWGDVQFAGLHWCRTPGCNQLDDVDAHPQPYPTKPSPEPRAVVDLPDIAAYTAREGGAA